MVDSKPKPPASRAKGFTLIELMLVVTIIGILASIAIPRYQDYLNRSRIAEAFILATPVRQAVAEYYAHHGLLPKDNAAAGLLPAESQAGSQVHSIQVDQGAIHIRMRNPELRLPEGVDGILSIRPAINLAHPEAPLIWLCASHPAAEGLQAAGDDLTDLPDTLLPAVCKG